jgi:L-iditol 2-dehydrogenase
MSTTTTADTTTATVNAASTTPEKPQNMAVVLKSLKNFQLEEVPYPPKPRPKHVILRIFSVGICGSDVHYYSHGKCGHYVLQGPLILGHESSGKVVEVGEGVTHLKVGDRVAIEPGVPCRFCDWCRSGRYNLCPDVQFMATPPINGSLVRYLEHPSDFCYKLPDHVSYEEGSLLEPLAVCVHACIRGGVGPGSGVLITGAGPIGLISLLVAKACGATTIVITDVMENRLEFAKSLGADYTFKADAPNILEEIRKLNITQSIECSGAEPALALAIRSTSRGGKMISIGRSAKSFLSIPLFDAADNEVDIIGAFRYHGNYPTALALIASGRVNVKPLISHHFKMEESAEAFDTAEKGKGNAIKVIIHCE